MSMTFGALLAQVLEWLTTRGPLSAWEVPAVANAWMLQQPEPDLAGRGRGGGGGGGHGGGGGGGGGRGGGRGGGAEAGPAQNPL